MSIRCQQQNQDLKINIKIDVLTWIPGSRGSRSSILSLRNTHWRVQAHWRALLESERLVQKGDWRPRDRENRGHTSKRRVQSENDQTPKIGGTPTQHFASGLRYSTNSCNRADRLRTPQSPHSAREAPRKDSQLIRLRRLWAHECARRNRIMLPKTEDVKNTLNTRCFFFWLSSETWTPCDSRRGMQSDRRRNELI